MANHAKSRLGIKVPPLAYFLAAIAAELLLNRYAPLTALIPYPWRLLGILPIAAGLIIALLAIAQFARQRTTLHTDRLSSALVTAGVFALSRNPMYLAIMLTLVGEALWLGTLSPWLAPLVLAPALQYCFIPCEEALLAEAFGEEYARYEQRVRRWI
jgi:protein-S-isoprenylcysteine O-methyltransferase Ste14